MTRSSGERTASAEQRASDLEKALEEACTARGQLEEQVCGGFGGKHASW